MPLSATDHVGIIEMIDLHTHILSGLDDGAETIEESIQMCWISYRDGVRTIVAAPHTLNGIYRNDRSTILTKVRELNKAIAKCGMRNSECGINKSKSALCTPNSKLQTSYKGSSRS